MKIYLIIHSYDVDGGFGEAVNKEEILFATTNREDAEKYCRKYDKPFIYDSPYADLYTNRIGVREVELMENLPTSTLPPENSHYDYVKTVFEPGTKHYEEYWRRKRREKEIEEMKAACERAGCTFTPAY